MKKKAALIIIQLVAVTLVLVLTVTTYAWFSNNLTVSAARTTVTAANSAYIVLGGVDEDIVPYMGQIGTGYPGDDNGGIDAPYVCSKQREVVISGVSGNMALKISFTYITVRMRDESNPQDIDVSNANQYFTIRVRDTVSGVSYCVDETGFLREVLPYGGKGDYLAVGGSGGNTALSLRLEIIFLSESSYIQWEQGAYEEVEPFLYHDVRYMRAVFRFLMEVSVGAVEGGG